MWLSGDPGLLNVHEPPYTSIWASPSGLDAPQSNSIWFEDSSYVHTGADLRRVSFDGEYEERWRLPLFPGEDRSLILGSDERIMDD